MSRVMCGCSRLSATLPVVEPFAPPTVTRDGPELNRREASTVAVPSPEDPTSLTARLTGVPFAPTLLSSVFPTSAKSVHHVTKPWTRPPREAPVRIIKMWHVLSLTDGKNGSLAARWMHRDKKIGQNHAIPVVQRRNQQEPTTGRRQDRHEGSAPPFLS